jgi:mRNA interferase MazF
MTELKNNKNPFHSFPRYGEIYLVYLNPRCGREVGKLRPAVVVSNNIQNEHDHHIIIAPLSDES